MKGSHTLKIIDIKRITHNVKIFRLEKPEGYKYIPGQATKVSVNKPEWKDNKHEFTFTSLNTDSFLEFTIKGYPVSLYPEHEGVTETLHKLEIGDELIIEEPYGTINYKGTGIFVAGGAGITPFIAIIKDLRKKGELKGNKLIFSNKTEKDVILGDWFKEIFDPNSLILTLTQEEKPGFEFGRVDENFLKKHIENFDTHFYLCGPGKMVKALRETLSGLGAKTDSIVFEE